MTQNINGSKGRSGFRGNKVMVNKFLITPHHISLDKEELMFGEAGSRMYDV